MPIPMPAPLEIALGTEGDGEVRYSCIQWASEEAALCRNDLWLEGTFGRFTGSGTRGYYSIVHGGFDRRIDSDMLVGVSAQFDRFVRKHKAGG